MELLQNEYVRKGLILLFVVVVAYVIQHAAARATRRIIDNAEVPSGSIFVNIVRALVWFFALLAVLEPVFGVQPTAFVAALGVTSIALSFGLQSTISNIISGLGLMLGRVIEVGDIIEVAGYRGVVTDVTWRATTLRTILGDVIVIPNAVLNTTTLSKLAPISARGVTISLDIHPEADMPEVERDVRASVEEAVAQWMEPGTTVDLIEQGYGPFGFRLDVRVVVRDMNDALAVRSAMVAACSGRPWLARW